MVERLMCLILAQADAAQQPAAAVTPLQPLPLMPQATAGSLTFVNMVMCALFVSAFAAGRFAHLQDREFGPHSKATTTAFRYYRSLVSYQFALLAILVLGSSVPIAVFSQATSITLPDWANQLPSTYIVALLLTTSIPGSGPIRKADDWIRQVFYAWAEIPTRARRIRDRILVAGFKLPEERAIETEQAVGNAAMVAAAGADRVAQKLVMTVSLALSMEKQVADLPDGLRESVKDLIDRVRKQAEEMKAVAGLSAGDPLRGVLAGGVERLRQEVCSLGARVILCTTNSDVERTEALVKLGFEIEEESLVSSSKELDLATMVFLFVFVVFVCVLLTASTTRVDFIPIVFRAATIALSCVFAAIVPVLVVRRWGNNTPEPGKDLKPTLWVASGLGAVVLALAVGLVVRTLGMAISEKSLEVGAVKGLADAIEKVPWSMMTFMLATVLAVAIDACPVRVDEKRFRVFRGAEVVSMGLAAVFAAWIVARTLPTAPADPAQMMVVGAVIGVILGVLVPAQYRKATASLIAAGVRNQVHRNREHAVMVDLRTMSVQVPSATVGELKGEGTGVKQG